MTDTYSIEITVNDGDTYTFTSNTAYTAQNCVAAFVTNTGKAEFATLEGYFVWPWDDISSCKVTRQPTERKETR